MAEANTRPTRAEEVRQERRRRPGAVSQTGMKLTVDESQLDRKNFEYRWVKDAGARVPQLTADDYDPAPEDAVIGNEGAGTVGTKIGGTDESGKPYGMILMRKRKDWYRADQKDKERPLDEIDAAIKGGRVHERNEPDLRDGAYTPGENTIIR